jgi:hypothetical protein
MRRSSPISSDAADRDTDWLQCEDEQHRLPDPRQQATVESGVPLVLPRQCVIDGLHQRLRGVGVRTRISATLSATSIPLGRSVTLSGSVTPSHGGKTVYLQRLVNDGQPEPLQHQHLFVHHQADLPLHLQLPGLQTEDTDHLAGYSSTGSLKVY